MKEKTIKTAVKSPVKKKVVEKKASTPKKSVLKTAKKSKFSTVRPVSTQPEPQIQPQALIAHRRPLLIIPK
jgi:hypothetical protein